MITCHVYGRLYRPLLRNELGFGLKKSLIPFTIRFISVSVEESCVDIKFSLFNSWRAQTSSCDTIWKFSSDPKLWYGQHLVSQLNLSLFVKSHLTPLHTHPIYSPTHLVSYGQLPLKWKCSEEACFLQWSQVAEKWRWWASSSIVVIFQNQIYLDRWI